MKSIAKATLAALVCLPSLALAQAEPELPVRQTGINEVAFQFGLSVRNQFEGQFSDFDKLMPGSAILAMDRSGYGSGFLSYHGPASTASVLAAIDLRQSSGNPHRTLHQWRTGITYTSGGGINLHYSRTDRTTFDVLTSAQTGNTVYLDSITYRSFNMNYHTEQLRLDNAYLLRLSPGSRFSVFTGIGFTAGMSLNSTTEVSHHTWYSTQTRDAANTNGSYYYSGWGEGDSGNYLYETRRNKTSYGFSGYVPLGLDFRLANRNELLSRMHLYLEARPGVNVLVVPELTTYRQANITTSFGIRARL